MPRSVAAGICARPEDEKTSRAGGLRSSPEGFSGRGIRPVCCVLRRAGRACGSVWGTFGRVLKNVRLSAAAARRLRCRLRCRLRSRLRSSHRRSPHCCTLAFVVGGSRLRRSWPDMKNPGDLVEVSGIRFPGCAGLELVGCADIDENRILVVLSGLDHPLEACREVPVAGYREVGAAAQIDAARPSADIVGAQTRLRIDMPVRAILKRYCTSALMSTEQNFLQMAMMPDSMRQLSVKL